MPYWLGSILAILVCSLPLRAQDKSWPAERGPSRELVKYDFDAASIKKAPPEYLTDYPAAFIHASTSYRVEEDGVVECTTHEVIRLNNRKGIDLLGEYRNVTYCPAYEKLTLNEARIVKSDGRAVAVEAKNVQMRDVQTDYYVYDTSKELIISFPGLEVGDTIDVKWTTRGQNPEYAGEFFTRYHFGDEKFPILSEFFSARIAKGKAFKYSLMNPALLADPKMEPKTGDDNGAKTYIWKVEDRRPRVKEDHMPSKEELRPGIAFSTFPSWDAVAAWERKVRANCARCTPDIKAVVKQIKHDHQTTEAIARELTYWVRGNVRYVSTGDKHDFTPHPAELVFKNRFGDCKDGAELLSVMLAEAGIPSGFVSLSPLGDGQVLPAVPSPWSTHAILFVNLEGKEHWIDTTAAHAGWDFLPHANCDRVAYIIDEKNFRMMRTPKFAAESNRTETVTKMTFEADGTSHNVRSTEYFGEAAVGKRDEWVDVSAKERRRLIRNDLLESHSKVRVNDDIAIDEKSLRQSEGPVKLKVSYVIPQHFLGDGDLAGTVSDNALWSPLLGITVDPERESDLVLKGPFESVHRFEIDAPKGYMLEDPPEDEQVESKWGTFSVKVQADEKGKHWTIECKTHVDQTHVSKADLSDFRKFQEEVLERFPRGSRLEIADG